MKRYFRIKWRCAGRRGKGKWAQEIKRNISADEFILLCIIKTNYSAIKQNGGIFCFVFQGGSPANLSAPDLAYPPDWTLKNSVFSAYAIRIKTKKQNLHWNGKKRIEDNRERTSVNIFYDETSSCQDFYY